MKDSTYRVQKWDGNRWITIAKSDYGSLKSATEDAQHAYDKDLNNRPVRVKNVVDSQVVLRIS